MSPNAPFSLYFLSANRTQVSIHCFKKNSGLITILHIHNLVNILDIIMYMYIIILSDIETRQETCICGCAALADINVIGKTRG
jgi:hypothetical protein